MSREPSYKMSRRAVVVSLVAFLLAVLAGGLAAAERGFNGRLAIRGDRVLASENASRLFKPGSVQKLLVATAALHHLGPEHRLTTRLASRGPLADGTLGGDLILLPAADPSWSERFHPDAPRAPLDELARRLAARGVRRVTGDLVVDLRRFPGRPSTPSRPLSELAFAYAAPTSALAVDENRIVVEIAPGSRIGAPGTVSLLSRSETLEIDHRVVTVGPERHEKGTVDFLPVWESRRLIVRGEYPISEPSYRVELAHPWPERAAADALLASLAAAGIHVEGTVRLEALPGRMPSAEPTILAELASPPIAELLGPILEDSHNWIAEMLLRALAAEVRDEGRDDTGLELIGKMLVEDVGIDETAFSLDDASGLSPYDLVAPEAVTKLLAWAWDAPWRDVFVEALAAPGEGTLRAWGPLPPLAAKTGTTRGTSAIAGYLHPERHLTAGTEPTIFVAFLNHRTEERAELRRELRRWLWELNKPRSDSLSPTPARGSGG